MMYKKIIKSTPFGSVCIAWRETDLHPLIVQILLSMPDVPAEDRAAMIYPDCRKSSCTGIDTIADSIKAYLEGENVKFSLNSVDLEFYTPFQQTVLRAQHAIPLGRVSTYGLIADHVGVPGGARAVGNVMAANPFPLIVPCHRTILSDFRLGGFQSGAAFKRALLEREGVVFDKTGRVICMQLHYEKIG